MDRTCENCKWFRMGQDRIIKGGLRPKTEKDPDTCGFLNRMEISEARIFNVPDAWGREHGVNYVARHKQVEGPCKAEGIFWQPNINREKESQDIMKETVGLK